MTENDVSGMQVLVLHIYVLIAMSHKYGLLVGDEKLG